MLLQTVKGNDDDDDDDEIVQILELEAECLRFFSSSTASS